MLLLVSLGMSRMFLSRPQLVGCWILRRWSSDDVLKNLPGILRAALSQPSVEERARWRRWWPRLPRDRRAIWPPTSARACSRTSLNSQVRLGPKPIAQSSMKGSLNSSSVAEITCRELARFESGGALGSVGGASAGNAPELSRDSYGGERDKEGREGV